MDVKHSLYSARPVSQATIRSLAVIALVGLLGQATLTSAEVVVASDTEAETSSMIFVTDDAPVEPPQVPQSVEGSIVFVEDEPAVATKPAVQQAVAKFVPPQTQSVQPPVRGDLKVVTNQSQPTAKLTAVRPIAKQQPLTPLAVQPVTPKATVLTAAVEAPLADSSVRELPGDIQPAVHAEPVLGPIQKPQPSNFEAPSFEAPSFEAPSSPESQLIAAYQLSLKAETAAEYTKIAELCSAAQRHEIKGDQRSFANKLASWALNRRGQLRAEAGEQDLANADFQAAIDFHSRNWRALHNRGVSFAQAGSFAEAFDDFNAVIQINPKYAKAYANRATLYVQAKDLESAVADYERAIEQDEKFATARVGLGRVCHMLGRWDEAIAHFSAAIEIEPQRPDIICSRGDLHADMGNYGQALADYAQTIEIDPEFGHAYRNGAWLLATCPDESFQDPTNAVLGAEQALEYSYGERHVALDTLAAALASNGQFDEAISTITQAVDLAPEQTKFTYLSRMQLYQEQQPFRTEPVADVAQVTYEVSDQ